MDEVRAQAPLPGGKGVIHKKEYHAGRAVKFKVRQPQVLPAHCVVPSHPDSGQPPGT
ncbi:hypothetical protein LCGC14_2435400, partial [marine sediment metagenome]